MQVVGGTGAAFGDQAPGVLVELVLGGGDDRQVLVQVAVEDPQHVGRPAAEQLPVLLRRAEQLADDRDRVGLADVDRDVGASGRGDRIDERVHDLTHERAQAVGGTRRERLADEPAEAGVHVALGRQDRLTVALRELRVVDPVHLEDPTRRAVPALVAEHGDDVVVVQHREAERVAGDPTLPRGLGDGVGLFVERHARIEEVEHRQFELEHRGRGRLTHGADCTPGRARFFQPGWVRPPAVLDSASRVEARRDEIRSAPGRPRLDARLHLGSAQRWHGRRRLPASAEGRRAGAWSTP